MTTQPDDGGGRWPSWLPRLPWLLLPFPVAFIHMMGIRSVALWRENGSGQPGPPHGGDLADVSLPPAAIMLGLLGPVALFATRLYPRTVLAMTALAAVAYYSLGYPPGPVFVAPLVALIGWVRVQRLERLAAARRMRQAERERRAESERLRIAQELHDLLAHHISLINVQSTVALHLVDERPQQSREALSAIKDASSEALTALRGALEALRGSQHSAPRSPTGGLAQLDNVVDNVRAAGVDVTVNLAGEQAVDPAVDLAALRIVQESLTNVLRHSAASAATVTVVYGERLDISVTDNGTGGVPVPGNGLTGMSERATALGGTFSAGPAPAGGFQVHASLPSIG